jgi:hypothetical protein
MQAPRWADQRSAVPAGARDIEQALEIPAAHVDKNREVLMPQARLAAGMEHGRLTAGFPFAHYIRPFPGSSKPVQRLAAPRHH